MILLNPGPVNLSQRVRRALAGPDLCHREPEFAALQTRVRRALLAVYGLDPRQWTAVVLTGSGTTAVEAMLTSLVPDASPTLVVANGVYGERIAAILGVHGMPVVPVHHAWSAAPDVDAVARVLDGRPDVRHVAVVHHETTTGRLNDLAALGAACRARGVALLVDAVSSFGAEAIDFEGWGVAACAASSNKCLHGVPGTASVVVRRQALDDEHVPVRTLTLDLRRHEDAQATGGTLFTPAVHGLHALDAALCELADGGGWRGRRERYRSLARRVRDGLAGLGVAALLPEGASSCVLRSYRLPGSLPYDALHDELKRRGFVIYAGQAVLADRIFRVSTMGAITDEDVARFLAAFGEVAASRAATGQDRVDEAA